MFMTKIKSVLAVVLVVGLALGGIGAGVGLSTNPVVVAQEKTPDKAATKEGEKAEPKDSPLTIHGIVESVDAKKATITVKGVSGDDVSSVWRLHAFASDKKPAKGFVAEALLKEFNPDNYPKLVNVPVRSDAVIQQGKEKLQLKDLQAGSVVSLQLAPNRTTGFAIVGIRVMSKRQEEKKP